MKLWSKVLFLFSCILCMFTISYPARSQSDAYHLYQPNHEINADSGDVHIQPSPPSETSGWAPQFVIDPTGYEATNLPLPVTILYAFLPRTPGDQDDASRDWLELPRDFLLGGPAWVSYTRYDIRTDMKRDQHVDAQTAYEQIRARLRSALIKEFNLHVHVAIKKKPIYLLEFRRRSSKLVKIDPTNPSNGAVDRPRNSLFASYKNYFDITMQSFASDLSNDLDAPVFDKTGLTGKYTFTLESLAPIGSDQGNHREGDIRDITHGKMVPLVGDLGLRLRKAKVPRYTVVIDKMAAPASP